MGGEAIKPCTDGDVIDTTVHGNVDEAREYARWLKRLASKLWDVSGGMQRSLSVCANWRGAASDAYYDYAEKINRQVMGLEGAAAELWPALESWADDKATVKARMEQARTWARQKGMTVSGDLIFPPKAPPAEPTLPDNPTPQQYSEYEQAGINFKNATDMWNEFTDIKSAVNDNRGLEKSAEENLADTLSKKQADLNGMITTTGKAATTYLTTAGAVNDVSKNLAAAANDTRDDLMEAMRTMKAGGTTDVVSFQKAYDDAVAAKQAHDRGLGGIPGKKAASWNFGGKKGFPLLRKLPVLGTVGGTALAGVSILNGQSPGEAVTRYATSTGTQVLADDLATAALPEGRIFKPIARAAIGYFAGQAGDYLGKEAYEKATKEANDEYGKLETKDK
ncbi:hypothetical protein [Sciscionella sediminilitoris]|uniref:hypothetical protein n=1 Tax=Sciscionella sediminilitoris TaxID=1445613 RepID=UPI0004DF4C3E|nr:hypothetical protein [Sciscionella sp. SE31]